MNSFKFTIVLIAAVVLKTSIVFAESPQADPHELFKEQLVGVQKEFLKTGAPNEIFKFAQGIIDARKDRTDVITAVLMTKQASSCSSISARQGMQIVIFSVVETKNFNNLKLFVKKLLGLDIEEVSGIEESLSSFENSNAPKEIKELTKKTLEYCLSVKQGLFALDKVLTS